MKPAGEDPGPATGQDCAMALSWEGLAGVLGFLVGDSSDA